MEYAEFRPDKMGKTTLFESPRLLVGLNAFVISTTVLIRQNRMSRLADHHAHLDLQVNLLTEEKTSKIIALLEEFFVECFGFVLAIRGQVELGQLRLDVHGMRLNRECLNEEPLGVFILGLRECLLRLMDKRADLLQLDG